MNFQNLKEVQMGTGRLDVDMWINDLIDNDLIDIIDMANIDSIQNLQLYGQYYHNKTNNLYVITGFCKVKDQTTRQWNDGVVYSPVFADKSGQKATYIRTVADFINNFRNA